VRRGIGTVLVAVGLVLGGYGVWLIATRDVQGGRDEAGALIIGAAVLAAVAGAVLLRRRS
jgi:MYXO-CTERM domain-containing protein